MRASGSVGRSITAQKHESSTLIRSMPLPTYRYTLPQAYQRWLYEDYAYLWRQQSQATKQEYRTAGVRFHLTGFQYWMKYHLTNLPDILGWWHLDERSGATATDFSKNANHGTIVGASPTDGLIDGAYYFDHTNDWINMGIRPTLQPATTLSFFVFIKPWKDAVNQHIAGHGQFGVNGFQLYRWTNDIARLFLKGTLGATNHNIGAASSDFHSLGFTYQSGVGGQGYQHGLPVGALANIGDLVYPTPRGFALGRLQPPESAYWLGATLDEAILYNRVLDDTEALRLSERRYPPL